MAGNNGGFRMVDEEVSNIPDADCRNHRSAIDMGAQVLQQIRAEIAEGNYQVTSEHCEKPVVICSLVAVAKDDGSARLIHDCSRPMPCGKSINGHATLTSKQCFDSVDDAVELIKDGYSIRNKLKIL